jgi:hypothetical protein
MDGSGGLPGVGTPGTGSGVTGAGPTGARGLTVTGAGGGLRTGFPAGL